VSARVSVAIGLFVMALQMAAMGQVSPTRLTLRDAITIALDKNPLRKAALADTHVASADTRMTRSALYPHLAFSETATRGNDPVYVFGGRLRQQRFSETDFSLNRLNTPLPFGNFTTRFSGTWQLFDSFATWHNIARAQLMNQAAEHQLTRTEQEVAFQVVASYYEVLLSSKQLDVAENAVKTASAIVDRSQSRFDSGLSVESDLLTSRVRLATRQQESIRSKNNLAMAIAQLNTVMGEPIESSFELAERLAEPQTPAPVLKDAESLALKTRPDLKRIAAQHEAQQQSVSIAKSAFGPQVNVFAGWELDNPTFLAGGGGNNWVSGVEVKVDLFQGGAKRAELSRQRALEEKSAAMSQSVSDAIRLDVRRAYYDWDASRQQVEVARASIAQAEESLRINKDRYETGLITITDLLNAEDTARQTQTDYWGTVCRLRTSYARLELATGTLNSQSPAVMP
jgi:outer membrane protein